MSGVVADTSVWIEFLGGRDARGLEEALEHGLVVLPPLVVAELISGTRRKAERASITELIDELPVHDTPIDHWVRVGELRRTLLDRGLSISTPDAHVAQCALDRDALLLSRDAVFTRIGRAVGLKVSAG